MRQPSQARRAKFYSHQTRLDPISPAVIVPHSIHPNCHGLYARTPPLWQALFLGREETTMKAILAVAGVALFGLALASWATLARGQQAGQGGLTVSPSQPGDSGTLVVLPPRDPSRPVT